MYEFNGVDAVSGHPLLRLNRQEMSQLARGEKLDPAYLKDLKRWSETVSDQPFDVVHGVDVRRLEEAGWGVIWPHGIVGEIREALQPLIDLRRTQAGERFKELKLRPGEATLDFLARHGVGPAPVDPRRLPYYLLIVGTPEQIPFQLQYRLDVQYAVGRIAFDEVEDYANYARSVVAAEKAEISRPRRVSLIGVANEGDGASTRSARDLVTPLFGLAEGRPEWEFEKLIASEATKSALGARFGGEMTPALAFVACHGLGYPRAHAWQRARQGALVCQEWRPTVSPGSVPSEAYFAGEDIADSADVAGLVAFIFACYGAGTPKNEDFFSNAADRRELAEAPFVARLPQRLLAHPRGGALAVIGHVERAWTYSFDWPQAGPQLQVFESAIGRLLDGYPVGAAMEYFGQRFAELAVHVKLGQDDLEYEEEPDVISVAGLMLAFKDARAFVVLGDPAVRLATNSP
jgi:hypothetical protein